MALCAALLQPQPAVAQTFVPPGGGPCVVAGGVVTCTGNVLTGIDVTGPTFDTLIVENVDPSGISPASGVDGINFETTSGNIDIDVDTSGTAGISTTGIGINGADGIFAFVNGDGSIDISNSGSIQTANDASEGIIADVRHNGNIDIVNIGDISTLGAESQGIEARVGNGNIGIVNTGDIQTSQNASSAITAAIGDVGGNIDISNSGTLSVVDGSGIEAAGADGTVVDIRIKNTGNITASNAAIVVGRLTPSPATITTSGILSSGSGITVNLLFDGNDVVNLLPGSILNGAMDFGNGNDGSGGTNTSDIDTLNFLPGLNATVHFADAGGTGQNNTDLQSAPEIVNFSGGGVLISSGLTAVAVDATGFAGQGTQISDVTNAIFNVIDNQDGPSGGGLQSTQAFARGDGSTSVKRLWGSAFGGHHHLDGTSSLAPYDHNFGGLATGLERGDALTTGAFGLFGGYSYSDVSIDFNAGGTETDTAFGGAYWKRDYGSHRIHAAFSAGWTDNDVTRLANGVNAEGDFNGYFIAPSLTASVPVDRVGRPMNVSGRVTYVYMHLDGYTETGIALPLTVGERDVSLFNLRAQFNFPQTTLHENGNTTRLNWAIGVDATVDAGSDNVSAIVAATPFSFAAATEDEVSAFLGLNVAHTSADGRRTVGIGGELKSDFSGGVEAAGEARASHRF